MAWDLGKAMRKKEEFESARLIDFEFRQRARAAKALAQSLGIDRAAIVHAVATYEDGDLIDFAAAEAGKPVAEVTAIYQQCLQDARAELIAERGDPTPFKMA